MINCIKIKKENLIPKAKILLPVFALGISPFIMNEKEAKDLLSILRCGGEATTRKRGLQGKHDRRNRVSVCM